MNFFSGWSFSSSVGAEFIPQRLQSTSIHFRSGHSMASTLPSSESRRSSMNTSTLKSLRYISKEIAVGWSLGGLHAIQHCIEQPQKYKKLILINSTPYFSQFTDAYWQMANEDLVAFQEQFLRWMFYPAHPRRNKNWQSHWIPATPETKETLLTDLYFLKTADFRAAYKQLTLPILRIQSSEDALIPLEYFSLPNEQHEILSGSHALLFTNPELVMKTIHSFLCH